MQAHGVPLHEGEPAGLHDHLREASAPHDAAETETRRVTASPLTPAEARPPEAPHATCDAVYTEVIAALVIAALHALAAPVWDGKKRGKVFQERVEEVAESPTVEPRHRGTTPGDHQAPLCRSPRPVSHDPRRAEHSGA
jgi:hypothetical protein